MKIAKGLFYAAVMLMVNAGVAVSCYASEYQASQRPEIFLIVTDSSKEAYGAQLKNEVFSQIRKQLNGSVNQTSAIKNQNTNDETHKIN